MNDEPDVLHQLEPLRAVPSRSDTAARAGLQAFLNEAAQLRPSVSTPDRVRPTGWKSLFQPARSSMLLIAKIALIFTLIVGGAGATAVAAQGSLPNEPLYPIKLLIEDVQWGTAQNAESQINVQLAHAQERVREMTQLADRDSVVPAEVSARLQTQLQSALQIAAQLDNPSLQTAMQYIDAQVMTQAQTLAQVQAHRPDDQGLRNAVQTLNQTQAMAQLGLTDPAAFRARFRSGRPIDQPTPPGPAASHTPQATHVMTATRTLQPSRTPMPSHTPQALRTPASTGTPQGNSYGPGPAVTPNQGATAQPVATPIGGGEGHEYGSQPTAQPGNGGPQSTPVGGGSGSGQTPEPGGNGGGGSGGGGGGKQ
ncbi:MAG: DUF5667 domain-containing protein [Anaerolineae bacterium]